MKLGQLSEAIKTVNEFDRKLGKDAREDIASGYLIIGAEYGKMLRPFEEKEKAYLAALKEKKEATPLTAENKFG